MIRRSREILQAKALMRGDGGSFRLSDRLRDRNPELQRPSTADHLGAGRNGGRAAEFFNGAEAAKVRPGDQGSGEPDRRWLRRSVLWTRYVGNDAGTMLIFVILGTGLDGNVGHTQKERGRDDKVFGGNRRFKTV